MDFKILIAFVTFMATFFSFLVCLRLIFIDLFNYALIICFITVLVDMIILHRLFKDEILTKG